MLKTFSAGAALLLAGLSCQAGPCEYTVEKVSYKGLVAKLYSPKLAGKAPVVISFGGSEGGISSGEASGEMLAPHCIAVLGLAYFKEAGLSPTLDQIPLEYFIDAIDYVSHMTNIDPGRIGMVSGSRGSEAALLVASMDARVKSVVVATPSSAVWNGTSAPKSAWTYRGKDVPALGMSADATLPRPQRYTITLDAVSDWDTYGIHVERIKGAVLLISAQNDQVWPSYRMAQDIVKTLTARGFGYPVRHDTYPTGHGFSAETAPKIKQSVADRFLETL